MDWRETMPESMQKIEIAIRTICNGDRPFATATDIAEETEYSKQTVLNNADGVARRFDEIRKTTVGQANVYYIKQHYFDEIATDETDTIVRLPTRSKAEYAELRNTPEDSEFDFVVHWYTHDGTEIEEYAPNAQEMGEAISGLGPEPVKIKFYDKSALPDTEPTEEGDSE